MSDKTTCRIVFWNIWHGGGRRASGIVDQMLDWNPDVVALAEFRGTKPSRSIAQRLRDAGLVHQLSTVNEEEPTWNSLLLASRFEVEKVHIEGAPKPDYLWLLAKAEAEPAVHIGVVHIPLDQDYPGFWLKYYRSLLQLARGWQLGPAVFVGDMNSGLNGLDEETAHSEDYNGTFMKPLEALGWRDMFRRFHPGIDAPTWYSRAGNGFRLDQAFVNPELQPCVEVL